MPHKTLKTLFIIFTFAICADSFSDEKQEKQTTEPPTNQQAIINEMRTELLHLRAEITNRTMKPT
jgi:hypothetical protein